MRRTWNTRRFAPALFLLAAGCTDRIPTLSDPSLYPGSLPTTIQHTIEPAELLVSAESLTGRTKVVDAFFKLVANKFDGSLDAHILSQFNGFPKGVTLGTTVDSSFTYLDSWVVASLPDTLRTSADLLHFELWTVTQPWDSLDVTWQNAVDRPDRQTPWTQPGGTPGQLLATAIWLRSATEANADSLRWLLPADVITALADSTLPGLMVRLGTPNARAEISSLVIEARVRPETQDTVVTQTVTSQAQIFVYTPEPQRPADILRVGGITSDRTLLRLSLDKEVPACPQGSGACADQRTIREVSINRVELLLDPVAVPGGYRPIAPFRLTFRRLLEPELGSRATLGDLVANDSTLAISTFTGVQSEPLAFDVTDAVLGALSRGETGLDLALLTEPDASTPSFVWFRRTPRLRFLYTLPQRPQLP